jgi:hypothetical protein
MNHSQAVSTGAVERYVLDQLSAAESEEFEQHFFDCSECSRDLHACAAFEDNARAVFLEERAVEPVRPAKPSAWAGFWQRSWSFAPAMAAVVLAAVTAYQAAVVIPGLRNRLQATLSPQPVASYVLPPLSRGDVQALDIPRGGEFYNIYMDPTWDGSFAAYLCSVQDDAGSTRFSVRLPAPPPGKPIEILMPRPLLPSGKYTVVIRSAAEGGKPEAELARYALILKID